MVVIGESAHFENEEGIWLAIAADQEEAVRVLVSPRAETERLPKVSLWWGGSATARIIRDWVEDTIKSLDPKLQVECDIEVWADDAPEEHQSYRIETVGRIEDDIQKWANDGSVACTITGIMGDASPRRDLVYMWAELKGSVETHPGEVGLQYATTALAAPFGRFVFSKLLENTAIRRFSKDEVNLLCDALAKRVADAASHLSKVG
jgi:hypothetical protein